jgi:CRISPR-associated endonuclease/helicase Cas3
MNRCILIDEAQTIPLEYAKPILDVLSCLVKDWGCSVVLMSATQPTFKNIDADFDNRCIDIIPDDKVNYYFNANCLVNYKVSLEQWNWQDIADKIKDNNQSLTIVNTTKLAKEGFVALSEMVGGKWFHLSARMVPAHRKQVLAEINHHLEQKLPCHVISTQVVEAGIDIDFPVVFRQIAPLDSIIQSAGRCNRENNNQQNGVVQVLELADSNYPSTEYKIRTNITRDILSKYDLNSELLDAINEYFLVAYSQLAGDKHNVQKLRRELKFEQVSNAFRIIDDDYQFSVFVPWQEGEHLLNSIELNKALNEEAWRSLQPYTINLPKSWEKYAHRYPCGLYVWSKDMYDDNFGATGKIENFVL